MCVHVIAYLVKQCWIHLNVLSSAQKQLQFQFGKFFTTIRHKLSLNSNHSWYIHDGAKLVPVCNWAILTNALNISCSGVGLHWTDIYEQLREAVRRPGVSSIDIYQLAYPNHRYTAIYLKRSEPRLLIHTIKVRLIYYVSTQSRRTFQNYYRELR